MVKKTKICKNCKKFKPISTLQEYCLICNKIFSKKTQIMNYFLRNLGNIETSYLKKRKLKSIENNFKRDKNQTKCFHCAKKIGIFYHRCRCHRLFCKKHKFFENHKCDFKSEKINLKKLLMIKFIKIFFSYK